MSFTGRLRLTLILAALIPTALITIIVAAGISQQVKRIEHREAEAAVIRFSNLLENAARRIRASLEYIKESHDFQLLEMGLAARRRPDAKYRLPLLSLDFVEYADASGRILLSAGRPALVGRVLITAGKIKDSEEGLLFFRYENDLHGSHPAIEIMVTTESGRLAGGIFLDGQFNELASAIMHADIVVIDIQDEDGLKQISGERWETGIPYRSGGKLQALLLDDPNSDFQLKACFHPIDRRSLFSDFVTAIIAVIIFSLLVVIPTGLYFSSRTTRRIAALTDGAGRVASGDFTQPVREEGAGEFAELAESFNRMMKQLSQYRDRLIVSQKIAAWQTIGRKIAHEVKNPLTPIAIAADDLRRSFEEDRSDFKQILDGSTATIKREVDRLKKLINEFSAFARMPAPEVRRIDGGSFIEELSVLFREEISQGRLQIDNQLTRPDILVDPDQFRQVLINLIKNGLESGGGRVTAWMANKDDQLVLIVEDNGPGFPDKILEEGITPYFSTKEGGSGLGMVICQRIVHDHDGSVTLENITEGGAGGARVVVSLPQKDA
jgi:signal transduction histidine kinase